MMSRQMISLSITDLSAFSRALAKQLEAGGTASHLSLMNMLARAGGWRNFQHLKASQAAGERLEAVAAPAPERVDMARVERALRLFDEEGRWTRFPSRRAVQILCVWAMWARIPRGKAMGERELNDLLNQWHLFGDPALLRRDMVEMGMLTRNADGTDYRRIEARPPAEARALIGRLSARG